jgi:hypothetical protein
MTYMRSWKSHRLTHIHGEALIHKLKDLTQELSVPLVYRSVNSTRRWVISTHKVRFPHTECNFYTHSVILTHTSVILTRIWYSQVLFRHARVWFIHAEYDYHAQSLISTRSVISTGPKVILIRTRLKSLRRIRLSHTKWDFDKYVCRYDTHDCDSNTHKSDICTKSVILTRMSVISTRTTVIILARVEFQHNTCDFNTHQLNFT